MERTNVKVFIGVVAFAIALITAGIVAPQTQERSYDLGSQKRMLTAIDSQVTDNEDVILDNGMVLHIQTERQ